MKYVIGLLIALPVLLLGAGLLRPELLIGEGALVPSMSWALIGTSVSYLGFVFSLFAVLEVRSLSSRYFAKQRLPEIKGQLEQLTGKITDLGAVQLKVFRSDRFMSETAVVIRQMKKIKASGFSPIVDRAATSHSEIQAMLVDGSDLSIEVNSLDSYWALFGALTELVDEIEEYKKEAQASL